MKENELAEIIAARDWCVANGGTGFGGFYDELLDFHRWRRTLPGDAQTMDDEDEAEQRWSGR